MPSIEVKERAGTNAVKRRVRFIASALSLRVSDLWGDLRTFQFINGRLMCTDGASSAIGFVTVWMICAFNLSGCGGEEQREKPKSTSKKVHLTGDWYDEYAEEKKTRKLNPADRALVTRPRECLQAAKHALNEHDDERAFELANYVLKLEPRNAEALFIRGMGTFYSAFGEESDAIKDLEGARELGYQSGELFTALAKLYDAQKNYDKAIEAASFGLKVCPDKDLYRTRASLYEAVGKHGEALRDLNEFIRLSPDKAMGYYVRANMFQQTGRYEDALQDYALCISKNPDSTFALSERAKLFLKLGREKEALAEISKVTDLDKSDDDAVRLRGDIYAKMKQDDRAIADYTRAISLSPEYARLALESRAKAYRRMGQNALAEKDFAEARKLKAKPAEKPVYELK